MFETLNAQSASTDSQCQNFITLYEKFLAGIQWNNAQRESGHAIPWPTMQRFRAIEERVDAEWSKIPETQRSALTEALILKKLLPEEVKSIIQTFDAKIVSLTKGMP